MMEPWSSNDSDSTSDIQKSWRKKAVRETTYWKRSTALTCGEIAMLTVFYECCEITKLMNSKELLEMDKEILHMGKNDNNNESSNSTHEESEEEIHLK